MKLISEKQFSIIVDSYYNGQFKQLREQLKRVSVRQLIACCEQFQYPLEIQNKLLKYKVTK